MDDDTDADAPARTTSSLWGDWLQTQYATPMYLPIAAVQALLDLFNVFDPLSFAAWQAALWSLSLALMLAPPSSANGIPQTSEDGSSVEYVKHFLKVFLRVLCVLYALRLAVLLLSNVTFQVFVDRPRRWAKTARARRDDVLPMLSGGGGGAPSAPSMASSSTVARADADTSTSLARTLALQQWARLWMASRTAAV